MKMMISSVFMSLIPFFLPKVKIKVGIGKLFSVFFPSSYASP